MKPSPAITALIRQAQNAALEYLSGRPIDVQTMKLLGALVHDAIVRQADLGLWDDVLPDRTCSRFAALRIEARFGKALLGEPPIVLDYDFSRTALPLLQVKQQFVGGA